MKGVFGSSLFSRMIYGTAAAVIILPDLWVMLYGLYKCEKDFPMFLLGALLCAYIIYLLQKFYSYRVEIEEKWVKISFLGYDTCIEYRNIICIHLKRNACYIVDREHADEVYYKGGDGEIDIDAGSLPVIQRPFLMDYDEIVNYLCSKCGYVVSGRKYLGWYKNIDFVSLSMLKKSSKRRDDIKSIVYFLVPLFLLAAVFLMGTTICWITIRGNVDQNMIPAIKMVFPVLSVVILYILSLRYGGYIQKLLGGKHVEEGIKLRSALIYILVNIMLISVVYTFFFHMLGRI